jgi:hypothetical protein
VCVFPACTLSWNSQRALGLSWWKEAAKFALLTIGLLMLGRFVCMTAMMVSGIQHMQGYMPVHLTHTPTASVPSRLLLECH